MSFEANHSSGNHVGIEVSQPSGWVGKVALELVEWYRSQETTLGRAGWGHTGVATRVSGSLQSGEPLLRALAESVGLEPGSREALQVSSLLALGGFLELMIRQYPDLARSGLIMGVLITCFKSHDGSNASDKSSKKQDNEDHPKVKSESDDFCTKCGGTGRALDHKGRNGRCVPCKGSGRGNRKFIGDPL